MPSQSGLPYPDPRAAEDDVGVFPLSKDQARSILRMADAAGPAWAPKGLVEQLRDFVGEDAPA